MSLLERKPKIEVAFLVMNLILFLIEAMTIAGETASNSIWSWGWFLFFIQILWILKSFKKAAADEIIVRNLFGRPINQSGPGLVLTPWPFISGTRLRTSDDPLELPAEPEKIDKKDQDNPAVGKVPPIRIVQADLEHSFFFDATTQDFSKPFLDFTEEEQKSLRSDPLNQRLTTEVNLLLIYAIKDGTQYVKRVTSKGGEEGRETLRKRATDAASSVLQTVLGKITPAEANLHKEVVSKKVLKAMEELVGEPVRDDGSIDPNWWGIDVKKLEVMQIDPGLTVNKAVASAASAGFKRRETIQDAEAEKLRLTRVGEGEGAKRKSIHLGEAEGLAAKAKIAETPAGLEVSRLETVRAALSTGNHTTVVAGSSLEGAVLGTVEAAMKRITTSPSDTSNKK